MPGESPPTGVATEAVETSQQELLPLPEAVFEPSPRVLEQFRERRDELDRLLADASADPGATAQAFADLGFAYLIYDLLEVASVCFTNARILAPDDYRWHYLEGYLQGSHGRLDESVASYQRALERQPESPLILVRLGRARLEQGEAEEARGLFQRALESEDRSAAALDGLGRSAAALGDDEAAVAYFERALALQPEASAIHYAMGLAYRRLGKLEAAREHLAQSGSSPARLDDPLLRPLADLGRSVQFFLIQGGEAMKGGEHESAAESFRLALEQDDTSYLAYRGLALSLERLGDPVGAMDALRRALSKGEAETPGKEREEQAEVNRVLGGLLAASGRDAEAIEIFRRSLELRPEQTGTRLRLANALGRTGRFQEAVLEYDDLAERLPEFRGAMLEKKGTCLANLGRKEETIAAFEEAIEADPQAPELRYRYAEVLEFLGDPDAATGQRSAAAKMAIGGSERARLLHTRGRDLQGQGRYDEALRVLRQAVEADPEAAAIRYDLASVSGHLGYLDEAITHFRVVLRALPDHGGARRGEIIALLLRGLYGEARVELQEGLRRFPRDRELAHLQARLLATAPDQRVRDGALSLEIATRLLRDREEIRVRETLALAYAELGRLSEAVELQRILVAESERLGKTDLTEAFRRRLVALENGQAWTAPSPDDILQSVLVAGG